MGGSAFPDTERLSESEYRRVVQQVRELLGDLVKVDAPVEVKDKAELCRARGKDGGGEECATLFSFVRSLTV